MVVYPTAGNYEFRDRYRRLEAARTAASRLDEHHAMTFQNRRPVRVAGHDDLETGGHWIEIQAGQIMQDINGLGANHQHFGFRQPLDPTPLVDEVNTRTP